MTTKLAELSARIDADPADGSTLRLVGQAFVKQREKHDAGVALSLAARAFIAAGQLPMAIVVAKELSLVDHASASKMVDELATAFGKGSKRVDASFRRRPPPPPTLLEPEEEESSANDKEVARAALQRAAARIDGMSPTPLPAFPLFHSLKPGPFRRLVAAARVKDYPAGATIIELGSTGDSFYVVARGAVCISRPRQAGSEDEVVLSHLRAGAIFGEMALLTETPRTAHATTETEALILEIARKSLDELAAAEPEFAAVLADYTRDRLLQNLLLTSALFVGLEPSAKQTLLSRFTARVAQPGERILDEGTPNASLFLVASGQLDVQKQEKDSARLQVKTLGPGDVVGEISLLSGGPCTASVRAATRSVLLTLSRDDFNAIASQYPTVTAHLNDLALQRLEDLERLISEEVIEAEDYLI